MFVHLKNLIERDCFTTASIHANDTDIIIISISHFHELTEWISFGRGKTKSWYQIHSMAQNLGPLKSKALIFFHYISGGDIISAFKNKGKKVFISDQGNIVRNNKYIICENEYLPAFYL